MNILILGAGENGLFMAEELSGQDHNVCVIESSESVAMEAREKLDAKVITGNGSSVGILEEAGVSDCDLFLGLCSQDNTNVVAASLAKALGAKMVIARVHAAVQQEQWLFDYRSRFEIDYIFSTEHLAAVELAKFLRNPDALIVEEVAGGKVELQQLEIGEGSPAIGKNLKTLGLPPRVRIGCVQRGNTTMVPSAEERLQQGDRVTLFGNPRVLQTALSLFRVENKGDLELKKVVIFGGGEFGLGLARMLENGRFRTRIIERNPSRCEQLSRLLKNATLINADATSARILREEQVGDADFFVAATSDDEDNVMTCLLARDLGVQRCVTLIHRADYADIVTRSSEQLGILGAVSPRVATKRDLVRFVTTEKFHTLVVLNGGIEIVEFVLKNSSTLAGCKVKDVDWPKGAGLIACSRGSVTNVPAAEDVLRAGDSVIALVSAESRRSLSRLIG